MFYKAFNKSFYSLVKANLVKEIVLLLKLKLKLPFKGLIKVRFIRITLFNRSSISSI